MKRGFGRAALFLCSALSIFATSAEATESYAYRGNSGFVTEFYLMGGKYSLFLFATRPNKGYNAPETRSCVFGGNLQRVWPKQEAPITLGSAAVSTIVSYKIGPLPLPLPDGRYRLFIVPLTNCNWGLSFEATDENTAGLAPLKMINIGKGGTMPVESASVADQVQFMAQYRTEHNVQVPVSGVVQIIHGGTVVHTFPLLVGTETAMYASAVFANVQFDQSDRKYLGKNTVKFLVKIGTQEFTSAGEFTLTE